MEGENASNNSHEEDYEELLDSIEESGQIEGDAAGDTDLKQDHPGVTEIDPNSLQPDHPLLKDAQEKLHSSLAETLREVENELRVQRESLKRSQQEREQTGLELFSFQQRYEGLKRNITANDQIITETAESRKTLDETLQQLRDETAKKAQASKSQDVQRSQLNGQLNEIQKLIRLLTMDKEKVNHEILVAKRSLSKAEQDLREKEQQKLMQDLVVDSFSQQIERLENELKIYETRIERHRAEDDGVKSLMAEATNEMDVIAFEKRKVLSQWKSSLANLGRKDVELQKLHKNIDSIKETIKTLETEAKGYDHAIKDAEFHKEMKMSVVKNVQGQLSTIQDQIDHLIEEKAKFAETFDILKKSQDVTDRDLTSIEQKSRLLKMEAENKMKTARLIANETQNLQIEVFREATARSSADKIRQCALRDGLKIREKAHELEITITQVRNEAARYSLEVLALEKTNYDIDTYVRELETKIIDENQKGARFEVDSRRISAELTKKQSELELLNRRYDKIVAGLAAKSGAMQGEIGPLESTIHHLQKSIVQKENEVLDLQQRWMRNQNEIVTFSNVIEELQESILSSKMKKSVIQRKLSLIDVRYAEEEDEIKELKRTCRKIQSHMERLNTVMVKHEKNHSKIHDNTRELEISFRLRLKGAEKECLQLEANVERIRKDAHDASSNLIEAERQFLLWKQKLQVAKDTHAALDPNTGGTEIRDLEYNLQKLKSRYAQLLKTQEGLVQEIRFSIERQVELNKLNFNGTAPVSKQLTHSVMSDLKKRVQQLEKAIRDLEINIEFAKGQHQELLNQLETMKQDNLMSLERSLMEALESKKYQKQTNLQDIVKLQTKAKRYEELKAGKYVVACKDPARLDEELAAQTTKSLSLRQIREEILRRL